MEQRDNLREVYLALITALNDAKVKANPELYKAVEKWANYVKARGKLNLNRPSWLLTHSIVDKVVDYQKSGKIWAIAGFEKTSGDKRSPGTYGQYHEAGWAPDRRVVKVPSRFLRRAKQESEPELKKDVDEALKDVVKIIEQTIKKGA